MKTLLTSISRGCSVFIPVLLVVSFSLEIYDRLKARTQDTPISVPEKPADEMNEQE